MKALYRKWRPQVFEEVLGQEPIVKTLINAVRTEKISHAYLFSGPRGVGKTTVARLLAKAAMCEAESAVRPCGKCIFCRLTVSGRNVDLLEIDAASNRGIDEIRVLRERVHFAPAKARAKVFIIDEVHMLTKEAFNALLKMLEEPPPHAIFVLATTEIHKVPLTIISRCQRFDFHLAGPMQIKDLLGKIAGAEQIAIASEALEIVAVAAAGSFRDAVSLLDQLHRGTGGKIEAGLTREVLGLVADVEALKFLEYLLHCREKESLELLRRLAATGIDWGYFVNLLMGKIEKFLSFRLSGDPASEQSAMRGGWGGLTLSERELLESIKDISNRLLLELAEKLIATEQQIKWSSLPILNLEALVVWWSEKISSAKRILTPESNPGSGSSVEDKTVNIGAIKDIFG